MTTEQQSAKAKTFHFPVGKGRRPEILLTLPSFLWLLFFFAIPTLLVFAIAFKVADVSGGIGDAWTFETIEKVINWDYARIMWRTVWVSLLSTLICLLLAVPVGYWISRQDKKYKNWYLLLVVIPLWTNFLIRIFAWRLLLHPDGIIRSALLYLGLIPDTVFLLNNMSAVIIVTVYTYLSFAILPIYAASDRFDFSLLEAARDLGASRFRAFCSIYLPGIQRGILTAFLIVFIPSLGSYAIPDLVGGVGCELLGNKIALRAMANRNLPEAAAISVLLALIIMLPFFAFVFGKKKKNSSKFVIENISKQ